MKFIKPSWYKEMSEVISSNFLWLPSRVLYAFPGGINCTSNSVMLMATDISGGLHSLDFHLYFDAFAFLCAAVLHLICSSSPG